MVLAVRPDVLHRIQFWRIRREVLRLQATFLVADELLRDFAAVARKPIPNQQDVAINVAEQVFEELDDLLGLDGLFEDLKIEIPVGDAGDNGQGLPVEVELEYGRLPSRRPGAPPVRPLAKATLVYEDDRPALFLGFFLISGQRLCISSEFRIS